MSQPPELLSFHGDWAVYEDLIYEVFLDSFVRPGVEFLAHNTGRRRGGRASASGI